MQSSEPQADAPKLSDYLSRSEAADRLGVHPFTVYRWGKRGLLTEFRTPSGQIKYSPDEVAAVLAEVAAGD